MNNKYKLMRLFLLALVAIFLSKDSYCAVNNDAKIISKMDSISMQYDSIKVALDFIEVNQSYSDEELKVLQKQFSDLSDSINTLNKDIEQLKPSPFQEFIYPIILSIIAAVIFWFAFSFIPEKQRKKKIRLKIEHEMYQMYSSLFSIFDSVLRFNNHSPSFYQSDIRGNNLKVRDIELGLQNKCMNESYFYDSVVKDQLIPVGESLANLIRKIDNSVDRIFDFNVYLSSEEILLLEEIRKKCHVYDIENYNKEAVSKIGEMALYPVNPSLSYMKNNLLDLYELFKDLQNQIFKNSYLNREIQIYKVQHFVYSQQYEKAIKTIDKAKKQFPKDRGLFINYRILSLFKLKRLEEVYKTIEKEFESKPHLVSQRSFIKELMEDKKIGELMNKYFSDKELNELKSVLKREQQQQESFIKQAKGLEDYYAQKSKK